MKKLKKFFLKRNEMNWKDLYTGRRAFVSEQLINRAIEKSKKFNGQIEDSENARRVQLLQTLNQKTYLISTNSNIYKVIDDRRRDEPRVAWSRSLSSIAPNNQLGIHVEPFRPKTDKLIIDALSNKVNLVSKSLFANIDIHQALQNLVKPY